MFNTIVNEKETLPASKFILSHDTLYQAIDADHDAFKHWLGVGLSHTHADGVLDFSDIDELTKSLMDFVDTFDAYCASQEEIIEEASKFYSKDKGLLKDCGQRLCFSGNTESDLKECIKVYENNILTMEDKECPLSDMITCTSESVLITKHGTLDVFTGVPTKVVEQDSFGPLVAAVYTKKGWIAFG